MNKKRRTGFVKISLAIASVFLIVFSLLSILAARFNYSNYWGGVVFGPFALIIGVLLLIMVLKSGKRIAPQKELFDTPLKDFRKW